jgi:hypothetical protein
MLESGYKFMCSHKAKSEQDKWQMETDDMRAAANFKSGSYKSRNRS